MYHNCSLIKCINNLYNSIALCLGIHGLTNTYELSKYCWLTQGVVFNSLECPKYTESDEIKK